MTVSTRERIVELRDERNSHSLQLRSLQYLHSVGHPSIDPPLEEHGLPLSTSLAPQRGNLGDARNHVKRFVMSRNTSDKALEMSNKIRWRLAKRPEKDNINVNVKYEAMVLATDHGLAGPPYQMSPVMEGGGQQYQVATDESSSTSSSTRSDLFDRTPSNTETEDTGLSSISSSDTTEIPALKALIKEKPATYSVVGGTQRAKKRVALAASQHTPDGIADSISHHATLTAKANDALLTSDSPLTSLTSGTSSSATPPKVAKLKSSNWRAGSSIPASLSWEEYGRQCVLAANASRLNPYALNVGEYRLLRDRIEQSQVTAYLNIRNGILRLWSRNPMVSVTQEEAAGCAKHSRYFPLAIFAHKWLIRNGYINFGCVEPLRPPATPPRGRRASRQATIAVIGAGVSGLGCARQLENLIAQCQDHWINRGEQLPNVVVLEGRRRIGGRVYSHPLRSQVHDSLPEGLRNTAEMGAQIITGFQQGNPMDVIVRGQLGLHYHLMWDEITMHDADGKAVNHARDILVNKIHNDILERTSDFRIRPTVSETLEGNPDLIDFCQEPATQEGRSLAQESMQDAGSDGIATTAQQDRSQVVPPGFAKLQGRTQVIAGNSTSRTAAQAARSAGWELRPGISRNHSLNLRPVVKAVETPNLGTAMDEAILQYQQLIQLTPQDMRLLNWHYADLEYANAAMVHQLSLSGHDQDSGNEFEGRHSEVVGGYIQVPRGLMMLPYQLDVQFGAIVDKITYSKDANGAAAIELTNGEVIEADKVILSAPLGVLKANSIKFQPPLPDWKAGAIGRLGFGLLNKLVLVFEQPFWDEKYDMFGLLNEAERKESLNPSSYTKGRGKFYLVWNCISNSGRPMLIALMSGNAAHAAEVTDTDTLVKDVLDRLSRTFAPKPVPAPVEVIVTRWKKDPFTRGTYSYVAPGTQPGDYDVMAAPVGNLHFAGEATCGTHPATVHGAYLSGLRAAAEVVESLIGPVPVPDVLVGEVDSSSSEARVEPSSMLYRPTMPLHKPRVGRPPKAAGKPKLEVMADAVPSLPCAPPANPYRSTANSRLSLNEELEDAIKSAIRERIGDKPLRPTRPGVNPFLLYTAEKWRECKAECSKIKQDATGRADAQATRNEVRSAIGLNWRRLDEEGKRPYVQRGEEAQRLADEARKLFDEGLADWERAAARIRQELTERQAAGGDQGGAEMSGQLGAGMNGTVGDGVDGEDVRRVTTSDDVLAAAPG